MARNVLLYLDSSQYDVYGVHVGVVLWPRSIYRMYSNKGSFSFPTSLYHCFAVEAFIDSEALAIIQYCRRNFTILLYHQKEGAHLVGSAG